jgi:hypothetical protein
MKKVEFILLALGGVVQGLFLLTVIVFPILWLLVVLARGGK